MSVDPMGMALAEARLLRARIRCEGMLAANQLRAISGIRPAYVESDFNRIITEEGISEGELVSLISFGECSEEIKDERFK